MNLLVQSLTSSLTYVYHAVQQVLFHHVFIQLLEDLANRILSSGFYALEFEQNGPMLFLLLRFCREGQLCRVQWLYLVSSAVTR